jgi:hypothetical protein
MLCELSTSCDQDAARHILETRLPFSLFIRKFALRTAATCNKIVNNMVLLLSQHFWWTATVFWDMTPRLLIIINRYFCRKIIIISYRQIRHNFHGSTWLYTAKYFNFKAFVLAETLSEIKSRFISSYLCGYCNLPTFRLRTTRFGKIPLSNEKDTKRFLGVYKLLFHSLYRKFVWDYNSENLFTSSPPDQ